MIEKYITRNQRLHGIVFAALVFLIALFVRGYRIGDIQPHHDESPAFGFARGEHLAWNGSAGTFLHDLCRNASDISEGDSPPMICVVAELFRFIRGEDLTAARWFHAFIQSLGIALIAWLAWRIFRFARIPAISVAGLAVFSVVSIFYGQFGEVYAIYFFAGVIQYLVYWTVLRKDYSWAGYMIFVFVAFFCGLFEYIQIWLTLGLLLAGIFDAGEVSRWKRLVRAAGALIIYGILSFIPFFYLMTKMSLSEGHLGYYTRYYPAFRELSGLFQTVESLSWFWLTRTYDLFNYHISLVFNKAVYRPLEWNWVSLPFIVVAIVAIVIRIKKGRGDKRGIIPVVIGVLTVFLVGNLFDMLPYGGLRTTLLLAPLVWLAYGEAVFQWGRVTGKCWPGRMINCTLAGLVLIPFIFSLPGFYRDRVCRLDLDRLAGLIEKHQPDTLIMAEATYDPFRMILQRHRRFRKEVLDRNGVTLTSFFELGEERWGKYPIPVPGEKVMALDFYLPVEGRKVGDGIFMFHPTLPDLSGPDWSFTPLLEEPGRNVDIREHQSIYYPPNSVYLYLMQRK